MYSYSLRAGRSVFRTPVGAIFSGTGHDALPSSCAMGTGSFHREGGQGVALSTHLLLAAGSTTHSVIPPPLLCACLTCKRTSCTYYETAQYKLSSDLLYNLSKEFFFCLVFNIWNLRVRTTRWFKYDRDKLWLVYTQIIPVIFEPPCIFHCQVASVQPHLLLTSSPVKTNNDWV